MELAEKIGADLSLTINLGNYNSAKVSVWRETELAPGETEQEGFDRIWEFITTNVDAKATEITDEVE